MLGCRAVLLLAALACVPLGMLVHEDFLLAYLAAVIACKLLR